MMIGVLLSFSFVSFDFQLNSLDKKCYAEAINENMRDVGATQNTAKYGLWNTILPNVENTLGSSKIGNGYLELLNDILWKVDISIEKFEMVKEISGKRIKEKKGQKIVKDEPIYIYKASTSIPNNQVILLADKNKKILGVKTTFLDGDHESMKGAMLEMDVILSTLLSKKEEELNLIESTLASFTGQEEKLIHIESRKKDYIVGLDYGEKESEYGIVAIEK